MTESVWNEEEKITNQEINGLLDIWSNRLADPKTVCTLTLVRIASLAGQFFQGDDEAFKEYLDTTMESAMDLYNTIEKGNTHNVH